jgi:hypothetical protein
MAGQRSRSRTIDADLPLLMSCDLAQLWGGKCGWYFILCCFIGHMEQQHQIQLLPGNLIFPSTTVRTIGPERWSTLE